LPLSFRADASNVACWRSSDRRLDAGGHRLKFDLLGDIQSIIYLNPEIPDGALQLRMAQEELHGTQVPSLAVNPRSLRMPHRMRSIKSRLQADAFDQPMH
jgi:hypothetical protein